MKIFKNASQEDIPVPGSKRAVEPEPNPFLIWARIFQLMSCDNVNRLLLTAGMRLSVSTKRSRSTGNDQPKNDPSHGLTLETDRSQFLYATAVFFNRVGLEPSFSMGIGKVGGAEVGSHLDVSKESVVRIWFEIKSWTSFNDKLPLVTTWPSPSLAR